MKERSKESSQTSDDLRQTITKLREDLALSNQMVAIESKRANTAEQQLAHHQEELEMWRHRAIGAHLPTYQQPSGEEEREDYLIATEPDDPMGKRCPYCGSLLLHDDDCSATPTAPTADVEKIARDFHDTYERLAPQFGYETRKDTKQFDPTSPNGLLMIAVCGEAAERIRTQARAPLVTGINRLFALVDAKYYEQAKAARDAALTGTGENVRETNKREEQK